MKKILLSLIACMALYFCGCQDKTKDESTLQNGKKLKIVTTILPEYLYVKEIVGIDTSIVELTMLAKNGVDLHSFQPSISDIEKIAQSDLFIYVGGESDTWVNKILAGNVGKKTTAMNLLNILGTSVKEEEIVEGMQAEEHEHHEHAEESDHEHHEIAEQEEHEHHEEAEEKEYDEHVWLSLKNTVKLVSAISEKMGKLDSTHANLFKTNANQFVQKLNVLDTQYKTIIDSAEKKVILFGDRFPFRYLADDYGLKYYAAFVGCSAESEASFETIAFLAGKVDSLQLPAILTIEGSNKKIAQTIRETSKRPDVQILEMNSMQSSSTENEITYLSIMEKNLKVLREALR